MSSAAVQTLSELIATPSINPRLGAANDDQHAGEHRLTSRLTELCDKSGWRWALQQVHPGRSNLIALAPGSRGDVLLWDAHQDTVGVERMTIAPFAASVAGGRVYGRGACDVKGGMAAMLVALMRLAERPAASRPAIIMTCTVNEECGFTGAQALADIWRHGRDRNALNATFSADGSLTLDELQALRPHAAIVAEPTGLNVVIAHRGVVRWQCRTHGLAAHSSQPQQGANAIYAMASVVQLIDKFHREQLAARAPDSLCGPSAVCVTTIRGGTGANTVPDLAVIDVDRRLTPDETPAEAYQELVSWLADRADLGRCTLQHDDPWMQSRGLSSGSNRAWAEQVAAAVQSMDRACELVGVPYGTNAATIAAAGIPTVVFGPGSIQQAHTADEWIAVDQLEAAVEALCRIASAHKIAPSDSPGAK